MKMIMASLNFGALVAMPLPSKGSGALFFARCFLEQKNTILAIKDSFVTNKMGAGMKGFYYLNTKEMIYRCLQHSLGYNTQEAQVTQQHLLVLVLQQHRARVPCLGTSK
jgi:hypothetical protein